MAWGSGGPTDGSWSSARGGDHRELVADALGRVLRDRGLHATTDPKTFEALLRDQLGGHARECTAEVGLVVASSAAATELSQHGAASQVAIRSDLVRRGVPPPDADWVTKTWSAALGITAAPQAAQPGPPPQPQPQPGPPPNRQVPPPWPAQPQQPQPQRPAQPPQPQGPAGPWPPARQTDTGATISLILGALSIAFCGVICGPIAIVVGGQAKKRIRNSGGSLDGEGQAKVGVILGWVGAVLYTVIIIVAIVAAALTPSK
jgi:hypothetical protein